MSTILKQEFKLLKIVGMKPDVVEERLNRLGAQGWNLVPQPVGAFMAEHLLLTRTDYVNSAVTLPPTPGAIHTVNNPMSILGAPFQHFTQQSCIGDGTDPSLTKPDEPA